MPLLSTELETPIKDFYDTEIAAVTAWADAIIAYFAGATGIVSVAVQALAPLVVATLTGMSAENAGVQKLQDAFQLVWDQMVAAPASFFPTATAVNAAPTVGLIKTAVEAAMPANQAPGVTRDQAAVTISLAIHPNNLGGTYQPPSPASPVPIV